MERRQDLVEQELSIGKQRQLKHQLLLLQVVRVISVIQHLVVLQLTYQQVLLGQ